LKLVLEIAIALIAAWLIMHKQGMPLG
jgi:hypothetical protein